jgi:hypothetical protein
MNRNRLLTELLIAAGMAALLALVSCGGSGSSPLVGRWTPVSTGKDELSIFVTEILEDGSGRLSPIRSESMDFESISFTWRAEKGILSIATESGSVAYKYKLSGTTLTLTPENGGESFTLQKDKGGSPSSRGNAGSPKALVGRWIAEGGRAPSGIPDIIELFTNGTGIASDEGDWYGGGFSWTAENGRLLLLFGMGVGRSFVCDYEISGNTVVMRIDDGRSVTYVKLKQSTTSP